MKRILKVVLGMVLLAVLAIVGIVGFGYARLSRKTNKLWDLAPVALSRPAKTGNPVRGKHLVTVRLLCVECHGDDLAGGTVIDNPMPGSYFGRNITPAKLKDWTDGEIARALRHGVGKDGHALRFMQAEDFQHLCEADLIDIIAYLRVVPAIERPDRASHAGPVFAVLAALNQLPPQLFSVEFSDHTQPLPPAVREAVTPEFGRYLYDNTCTGCHRPDHRGGKIKGSPPDWFPAANLTQDALSDWTEAGFIKTLRTGVNPSGSQLRNPMTKTLKYTPKYSETELKALWIYLKTVKGSEEF